MLNAHTAWDPTEHRSWARVLGLAYVPLFGESRRQQIGAECSVLLDGQKSSFALCSVADEGSLFDEAPIRWSWSSNLRHTVLLDTNREAVYIRRWDSSQHWGFRLPSRAQGAEELLGILERAQPPRSGDVIAHALRAFRQLRATLRADNPVHTVRLFNALILGAEAVRLGMMNEADWLESRNVSDTLRKLNGLPLGDAAEGLPVGVLSVSLGDLLGFFLRPEPETGLLLEPDLLIRHAAGQLYQEAHLILEREPQLAFEGLIPDERSRGFPKRDARFTPIVLARALVEQAISAFGDQLDQKNSLDILDPACGSGVFLQEALRELLTRGYHGQICLRGFDLSPISCEMARFCLERARVDATAAGLDIRISIEERDALQGPWGRPDILLMNPPFVPWQGMSTAERETVADVLGQVLERRADKAMAFLWRGVQALGSGAILASVLPATLFQTASGMKWREALLDQAELHLLGRFEGYRFFPQSMVETGFLVLRHRAEEHDRRERPITVVVAQPSAEEAAIRALRRSTEGISEQGQDWVIFDVAPSTISPNGWLPRAGKGLKLVEQLSQAGIPTVGELFDVRLGIRTGHNPTFVLTERNLKGLPPKERKFFKPVAGSSTIKRGVIVRKEYVFYPYDESGLVLKTEEDLIAHIPTYYSVALLPHRTSLENRPSLRGEPWWTLSEERAWLRRVYPQPKLVTKSFGDLGGFAYDEKGEYAVLQGHAWFWKGEDLSNGISFFDSSLPWGYLAILNSPFFEDLLACFCPRVQGGQFDLASRYVTNCFLPRLDDDLQIPDDVLQELIRLGRQIHHGDLPAPTKLREAAARAYGVESERLTEAYPQEPT